MYAELAATGRDLAPGEAFYSVLTAGGADLKRLDYSSEAWEGPPEGVVGWWRSRMPTPAAKRASMAPNDVLLEFFDQLEGMADKQEMRYVLALLLVRRRVMRLEEAEGGEASGEFLSLYCPRRDASYRIEVATPAEARTSEIQEELARLLFADAA